MPTDKTPPGEGEPSKSEPGTGESEELTSSEADNATPADESTSDESTSDEATSDEAKVTAPAAASIPGESTPGETRATRSLILGIVGLFAPIVAPFAIWQAGKARKDGNPAKAGRILGWIGSALLVIWLAVSIVVASLGLSVVNQVNASAAQVVTVGASPTPHAKILQYIQDNLAAKAGITIKIVEYDDYVQPNEALASGELDANYFQHLPYLESQIKDKGYQFSHGAGVHIEPYAAFSTKYKALSELPDGATIAITNDASNQIRGLRLLETAGLLNGITDDTTVVSLTSAQNPHRYTFEENQSEVIVQQLNDPKVDLAFINGNYILNAGLSTKDALAVEKVADNPYANLLVWRTNNTNPGVAKLEELLHSTEVADYIRQTWPNGDVIPGV
jgi:D-methionine transport system substrate-binding protein